MKNLFLLFLVNCFLPIAYSQSYWQQQTDYTIDVVLNDKEKTLDGFEKIIYTNNSPDTLYFIWFHLWPNAYKNDRTALSDQLLENGSTAFYFSNKEQRGYINRLDFKVDGATARTEDHPQHIDIIKLVLPKPLPPKTQTTITTPFHVKLPYNFSRGGYYGESFQVTQWYPKPAVYDKSGWHPMPYLDQGEYYSEFGSFDVQITLPKNYVVAATGELQNAEEKEWLKTRTYDKWGREYIKAYPAKTARTYNKVSANNKSGAGIYKTKDSLPDNFPPSDAAKKTLHFKQNNVHDFAWFADKRFIVESDTCMLASGKAVEIYSYYTLKERNAWQKSTGFAKSSIRFYSEEVGEYPYNVASVVQGYQPFTGGMEYPTITIISQGLTAQSLDATIAHELGHNWFYGILASNERQFPWMDEGMNTFYENKYKQLKYGKQTREEELTFQAIATNKRDQPIGTPSAELSGINYNLVSYHKMAEWMKLVEEKLTSFHFRLMMQEYFSSWKFRHPEPEDFFNVMRRYNLTESGILVDLITSKGILPNNSLKGTSVIFPLKKDAIKNYVTNPTKAAIITSPAIGANSYDKLMIGGLITNYGSPVTNFNFLAIPFYATGSKCFTGLGKINYAIRSNGLIRKTDLFLNVSSFTMDEFKDDENRKYQMRFVKLVPGMRFTFKEKNPRSTTNKFIQWKTFLINEQFLSVRVDSIITSIDTTLKFIYSTPSEHRYLNQVQFGYQNFRALYPFDVTLQVEQARDFVRTALTANYFFNYAKGGGLAVRLFAGKFNYLGEKTIQKQFANDRYHLNMTGANGYEDYTYSDYFVGRNKFEGFASQQIMMRDGGFKVRSDLLASKIGKTDNWLMAINFVTTIPEKINPLSVLPIKIPLRIFADIGSYAEGWDRNADTDRFLFDAGLHIPLFDESINIYIPLFYSKVYKDYFKSTIPENRFLKTMSFSINFFNKGLKKLNREFEF